MRLLLDECIGGHRLFEKLKTAGHDVVRSVDVVDGGAEDPAVFAFARENARIVVTYNNVDFIALADLGLDHPGLLLIYQDNDARDMTVDDIVKAIANVERSFAQGIAGKVLSLNAFRW